MLMFFGPILGVATVLFTGLLCGTVAAVSARVIGKKPLTAFASFGLLGVALAYGAWTWDVHVMNLKVRAKCATVTTTVLARRQGVRDVLLQGDFPLDVARSALLKHYGTVVEPSGGGLIVWRPNQPGFGVGREKRPRYSVIVEEANDEAEGRYYGLIPGVLTIRDDETKEVLGRVPTYRAFSKESGEITLMRLLMVPRPASCGTAARIEFITDVLKPAGPA